MYTNRFEDNKEYKRKIDAYRPLDKDIVKQIQEYYRIGLTYSSNALEGNTLDITETKVVLEDGLTINGKPLRDHLETLGHSDAFYELLNLSKNHTITENDIKNLHKLFYRHIDETNAGTYRTKKVIVTGSDVSFPNPDELSGLMQNFVQEIPKMQERMFPVEFAAMVHARFVNIHPFIDGNGRVARLIMNLALLQSGYNITVIPPVVRADYIRAIQETNHKNYTPFVNFISEMVLESQKEYLRLIKNLV
ncbi:MAG TPA: cell filamentation protein Fic [Cyanobacteria bacterium UBA11991]|nr:Fic family protein [Cyanobacteriota bacterium]MDY6364698.1 Fic family protein [Cyanobacteriota bacterium]HCB11137.1 cell filamentation protein Fic [Cyanobacteria bacterium UBA11991]